VVNTESRESRKPLEGVRVIDFTHFEAGTSATQLLAWFGAEVIKVEPPHSGEQGRSASADVKGLDSFYFLMLNANKKSMTLNMKNDEGQAIFWKLVEKADVVIQNWGPGQAEKFGVSYDSLSRVQPAIVYVAISGFPRGTSYETYKAFDPIAQATGGAISITGFPDGPPIYPGPTMADSGAGLLAVVGTLLAILEARRTGRGQEVRVSLQDAVMNLCRVGYARQALTGEAAPRVGNNLTMPSAPAGLFPCRPNGPNDFCYIYPGRGTLGDRNWKKLLAIMGREDLLGKEEWYENEGRVVAEEEVNGVVAEWTSTLTKHEVMRLLAEVGVPAGVVRDTKELSEDHELVDCGSIVEIAHPQRGKYRMPGVPLRLSSSENEVHAPPLLGSSTEQVLRSLLSYSADEVERLSRMGIV